MPATRRSSEPLIHCATIAAANFPPGSVVVNRQLAANTILVFRANDEKSRTVLLVLSGTPASVRADKKDARPASLALELSYIEDAANPDVFRIVKGQF